jgi:integrase
MLRWLWEVHGAPKLDQLVRRYPGVRPRNVIVREEERTALLHAAKPHVRLWLLLCSDLAIRSGTAAQLGPEHYNSEDQTLTFVTKCEEHLTLPVTTEIRIILDTCDLTIRTSFVRQLWQLDHGKRGRAPLSSHYDASGLNNLFRALCAEVGITRYIRPHDLRRTTAVAVLRHTKDIRDVQAVLGHKSLQSTIWYLDHDLRPVQRAMLEIVKRPAWAERKKA